MNTLWESAGGGIGVSFEAGVEDRDGGDGDMNLSGTGGTVFEALRVSDFEGGEDRC